MNSWQFQSTDQDCPKGYYKTFINQVSNCLLIKRLFYTKAPRKIFYCNNQSAKQDSFSFDYLKSIIFTYSITKLPGNNSTTTVIPYLIPEVSSQYIRFIPPVIIFGGKNGDSSVPGRFNNDWATSIQYFLSHNRGSIKSVRLQRDSFRYRWFELYPPKLPSCVFANSGGYLIVTFDSATDRIGYGNEYWPCSQLFTLNSDSAANLIPYACNWVTDMTL